MVLKRINLLRFSFSFLFLSCCDAENLSLVHPGCLFFGKCCGCCNDGLVERVDVRWKLNELLLIHSIIFFYRGTSFPVLTEVFSLGR